MSTSDPADSLSELVATRYWVQARDGNLYGPEHMLTLVLWTREARITPEMLIAEEQSDDWRRAETFPELNAVFSSPEAQALQALESLPLPNVPPVVTAPLATVPEPPVHHALPAHQALRPHVAAASTNTFAVTALVLGIAGLLVLPVVGPISAIVFGLVANGQIEASGGREGGKGLAVAGIILGVIGLPCGCVMVNAVTGWLHP